MKFLAILFLIIGFTCSGLKAQDPDCCSWYRLYKIRSGLKFFIPEFTGQKWELREFPDSKLRKLDNFRLISQVHHFPSMMVLKTPIKHTAFFCRMEDVSQKRLGVMIQFHVGDYNSYMDYKISR